jgi:hypothetical protein
MVALTSWFSNVSPEFHITICQFFIIFGQGVFLLDPNVLLLRSSKALFHCFSGDALGTTRQMQERFSPKHNINKGIDFQGVKHLTGNAPFTCTVLYLKLCIRLLCQ